jgi:hypothetical protein
MGVCACFTAQAYGMLMGSFFKINVSSSASFRIDLGKFLGFYALRVTSLIHAKTKIVLLSFKLPGNQKKLTNDK